jgi:hypothetical protein
MGELGFLTSLPRVMPTGADAWLVKRPGAETI